MTDEARTWRVGIIGVNPAGLFLLERMNLASDIRLVGEVFERDPARRGLAAESGCELWDEPVSAFVDDRVEVVFLMEDISGDMISNALLRGKHVVLDRPWSVSSDKLRGLAEQAAAAGCTATISCFRRRSVDFTAALLAKESGRLGVLDSAKFSSCEQSLPAGASSAGVLREFGFHWLDQLLVLTKSTPMRVFAKRFCDAGHVNDHGFLATIEFTNGCTAHVDVQTKSRLAHRTGWMLEGSTGSYRNDRLYTTTTDGEIIDEPLPRPAVPSGSFLNELVSTCRGSQSNLPTLAEAADVVQLIEALERSDRSGEAIQP